MHERVLRDGLAQRHRDHGLVGGGLAEPLGVNDHMVICQTRSGSRRADQLDPASTGARPPRPDCRIVAGMTEPADAADRRSAPALVCYAVDELPAVDLDLYAHAREQAEPAGTVLVPPREARTFEVPAGSFFRITGVDGPQVGDLNLWNANDLSERFFSGKTRQLHATHVGIGDRLWSTLPGLRPMATITADTLDWYGFDADGGGIHDVIGTRCDPYTNRMLVGEDYDHCCHSNLTNAMAVHTGLRLPEAEVHVHDVMNVFMCTGFTLDTHQYFMKASPVRPGDYIEFFAEIDLLGALSACPGGDCGAEHSNDVTPCYPLQVDVFTPPASALDGWTGPSLNPYAGLR